MSMSAGMSTMSDVSISDGCIQQITHSSGSDSDTGTAGELRFTLVYVPSYEKSLVSKVYVVPCGKPTNPYPNPSRSRIGNPSKNSEHNPYNLDGIRTALSGSNTNSNVNTSADTDQMSCYSGHSGGGGGIAMDTGSTPTASPHIDNRTIPVPVPKTLIPPPLDISDPSNATATDTTTDTAGFSFFHKMGSIIPPSSPLYALPLDPPPTAPIYKGASASGSGSGGREKSKQHSWEAPKPTGKSGRVTDQPVTFHTRIKSSGYGQGSKTDHDKWLAKQKKLKQNATANANANLNSRVSGSSTVDVSAVAMGLVDRENRSHTAPMDGVHRPAYMGKLTVYTADTDDADGENALDRDAGGRDGDGANTRVGRPNGNSNAKAKGGGVKVRTYPKDCGLIAKYQPNNDYPSVLGISTGASSVGTSASDNMQRPVGNIQFSSDASLLAIQYIDHTFSTVKLPTTRYRSALGSGGRHWFCAGHQPLLWARPQQPDHFDPPVQQQQCYLLLRHRQHRPHLAGWQDRDQCNQHYTHTWQSQSQYNYKKLDWYR